MLNIYDILDSLPEFIYITDIDTCEILYMNKTGKSLFPNFEGKKCYDVFHGFENPCLPCPVNTLEEDAIKTWKHSHGSRSYFFRSSFINWNNKKVHMCVGVDITDGENTKRELELRLDTENFTFQCIAEMHRNQPADRMFDNLLGMIGKFLSADRVYIFTFNGNTMSNNYEWCAPGIKPVIDAMQNIGTDIISRRIPEYMQRKSVIVKDINDLKNSDPFEYAALLGQDTHSIVTAPLFEKNELIGYIGADNPPLEKIENTELFFTTLSYFVSSILIRERHEKRLREIGYIDTLTGLFNRNKFIEDTTLFSGFPQIRFGVVYIDMNGLKELNDLRGHFEGDKALVTIAETIVKTFGNKHSYRVGGDEFVVFYPECSEDDFSDRIFLLKQHISETDYSISIGYKYSKEPCVVEDIVKIADEKMYQDKKVFYRNKGQSPRYRYRNDIFSMFPTQDALKTLLEEERFFILFQPKFSVETGEYSGAEALIRYFDSDNVIISPNDFLPEIEDNDSIHLIDYYVFRHVCKYISTWINDGRNPKPVSVNISHKTMLKSNFIENIMNIWYDYNIPKELIEIEVSEDKDSGGINDIINILVELKQNGFKIAVDNFGYKYADLYLFTDLKFDILKLDKDFVYKIETDEKARKLSSSLVTICHNENIRITAEGVESKDELNILKDIHCDTVQGYLFDKPMDWKQLESKYL